MIACAVPCFSSEQWSSRSNCIFKCGMQVRTGTKGNECSITLPVHLNLGIWTLRRESRLPSCFLSSAVVDSVISGVNYRGSVMPDHACVVIVLGSHCIHDISGDVPARRYGGHAPCSDRHARLVMGDRNEPYQLRSM